MSSARSTADVGIHSASPEADASPPIASSRRRAPWLLLAVYAAGLVLLVLSSVVDFRSARELEDSNAQVSRALEALDRLRTVGNAIFIAESASRGFAITGDPRYLASLTEMRQRIPLRLAEVGDLTKDTPIQREPLARFRDQAESKLQDLERLIDARRSGGAAAVDRVFLDSDAMASTEALRQTLRSMLDAESLILAERRASSLTTYRDGLTRSLVATVIVGVALTVLFLLMLRSLRQRDHALQRVEAANADLERRVRDRTADLSNLSRHLLDVREEEKRIIARDLHDDFGSYLTAINMDVSRARDRIVDSNPEQAQKLERTLGLLNSAIELKRRLISELRPSILDNLGLGAALEQYVEEWSRRSGVAATFDFDGDLTSDEKGCPIAIFRVFQEALANIAQHASATRVAASAYRVGDRIEFEIADDGIGISDEARHRAGAHGLLGIRERVLAYRGTFEIVNGASGGTIVRGAMPCSGDPSRPPSHSPHFA